MTSRPARAADDRGGRRRRRGGRRVRARLAARRPEIFRNSLSPRRSRLALPGCRRSKGRGPGPGRDAHEHLLDAGANLARRAGGACAAAATKAAVRGRLARAARAHVSRRTRRRILGLTGDPAGGAQVPGLGRLQEARRAGRAAFAETSGLLRAGTQAGPRRQAGTGLAGVAVRVRATVRDAGPVLIAAGEQAAASAPGAVAIGRARTGQATAVRALEPRSAARVARWSVGARLSRGSWSGGATDVDAPAQATDIEAGLAGPTLLVRSGARALRREASLPGAQGLAQHLGWAVVVSLASPRTVERPSRAGLAGDVAALLALPVLGTPAVRAGLDDWLRPIPGEAGRRERRPGEGGRRRALLHPG
jgi:hypothetical protein